MNLESAQWVGVGNDTTTIADNWRSHRDVGESSPLLVVRKSVGAVEVLVDDTGHTVLAMTAYGLSTVVPERKSVLDDDLEDVGLVKLLTYVCGR